MFLNFLWAMLNDLSFLMILSLISINIPGIAQDIATAILSFIYLDIFQTDKWLPQLLYSEYDDDDEALNLFFEINSYTSKMVVQNLGSTIIFLLIFFFVIHITLVIKVLSNLSSAYEFN